MIEYTLNLTVLRMNRTAGLGVGGECLVARAASIDLARIGTTILPSHWFQPQNTESGPISHTGLVGLPRVMAFLTQAFEA